MRFYESTILGSVEPGFEKVKEKFIENFKINSENGYADPDTQTGFAFAMNKLGVAKHSDPRQKALSEATFECIREL